MEYIIQNYEDKKVFNEIVGNLAGLHFINPMALD
jgi:hypothetical protein